MTLSKDNYMFVGDAGGFGDPESWRQEQKQKVAEAQARRLEEEKKRPLVGGWTDGAEPPRGSKE